MTKRRGSGDLKRPKRRPRPWVKVIDERFVLSRRRGGGMIRMEAWADEQGRVMRYNMAYVNLRMCLVDNGRVLGYDNSHGSHHRHEQGEVFPVEDFVDYQDMVTRFQREVEEILK